MDLTEIDGLGDLIAAETEMQRLQALNQMSGSLGNIYESWRDRIAKVGSVDWKEVLLLSNLSKLLTRSKKHTRVFQLIFKIDDDFVLLILFSV
jgi:tRNA U34 5-carboxymethylaminomethyl modifying GTPase MnmE/TrmE